MSTRIASILFSASLITSIAAHGMVANIQGGAKGTAANGFGVKNPNQFNQGEVSTGLQSPGCGGNANVDIKSSMAAAEQAGLPLVDGSGNLNLDWLQINGDGGGPTSCQIDTTGTGNSFKPCQVPKNIGNGGDRSTNPMTIQLDTSTVCTGGSGSTCLVKVFNGPQFGSCFAVKSPATGGGNGGNQSQSQAPAPAQQAVGGGSANADTGNQSAQNQNQGQQAQNNNNGQPATTDNSNGGDNQPQADNDATAPAAANGEGTAGGQASGTCDASASPRNAAAQGGRRNRGNRAQQKRSGKKRL